MCECKRGSGLEIAFIGHLQVVTTSNYNAKANLHTSYIIIAYAKSFQSSFISHFPVTGRDNGDSSTSPTKSSFHRLPYNWLSTD
jgi:hypothetical protein